MAVPHLLVGGVCLQGGWRRNVWYCAPLGYQKALFSFGIWVLSFFLASFLASQSNALASRGLSTTQSDDPSVCRVVRRVRLEASVRAD